MPSTTTMDAQALLLHAPFLRRLAASLLADASEADDVVQQAWLVALRTPPRSEGSLRAWLATVTRNLARERGRREARRRDWEAGAARSEAIPSTDEIVEREAVRRQVVEALLGLDALYRDVLLLRYYEDLPPRQIASRLGVPVETVRTRLKRGLAKLEVALDARHDGQRRVWALALLPLALPSKAAAGVGGLLGGLLPASPVAPLAAAGLAVALALAGASWWLQRGEGVAEDTPGEAPAALSTEGSAGPGGLPGALAEGSGLPAPPPATTAAPASPLAVEPPPLVEGRLLASEGGLPLPDAEVVLAGVALEDMELLRSATREELDARWSQRTVRTDGQGHYRVGGLAPGVWALVTPATGERPFRAAGLVLVDVPLPLTMLAADMVQRRCAEAGVEPPAFHALSSQGSLALDLVAPPASARPVRVRDGAGLPLAGATVRALSPAALLAMEAGPYEDWTWRRLEGALLAQQTDADGRVSAVVAEPGGLLLVSAEGHAPARLPLPADEPLPALLEVALEPAVPTTVAGRVLDGTGRPLAGATVCLSTFAFYGSAHELLQRRVEQAGLVHTLSDEQGRFLLGPVDHLSSLAWDNRPLLPGERFHVLAAAPGTLSAGQALVAAAGQRGHEVALTLVPGGPLEVTVLDRATLQPATDAWVRYQRKGLSSFMPVDGDGQLGFGSQPFGLLTLEIERPGYEPLRVQREDWRGEAVELLLAFEPVSWQLRVELVDGTGRALGPTLPGAGDAMPQLSLYAVPHDPTSVGAAGGRWLDTGGPVVGASWEEEQALLAFDRDWKADEAWVVARCENEILGTARVPRGVPRLTLPVRGRWLEGRAVPLHVTLVEGGGTSGLFGISAHVLEPATGTPVASLSWKLFDGNLGGVVPHPGTWDLCLRSGLAPGGADLVVRGLEVPEGGAELTVDLSPLARLALQVHDPDGSPVEAQLALLDEGGAVLWRGQASSDGRAQVRVTEGGSLRLLARHESGVAEVTVLPRPEQASDVRLALAPAGRLRLTAQGQPADALAGALLRITDGQQRPWFDASLSPQQAAALSADGLPVTLPAGTWRATLAGAGLPLLQGAASLGPQGEVTLALR